MILISSARVKDTRGEMTGDAADMKDFKIPNLNLSTRLFSFVVLDMKFVEKTHPCRDTGFHPRATDRDSDEADGGAIEDETYLMRGG